jgi:hypothetical protein
MSATLQITKTTTAVSSAAAVKTFDGFYFRNNLESDGEVPSAGPYDLCPDIIGSDVPIANAQSMLATPASWKTSFLTDPEYGANNFYYVRGLDGGTSPAEAQLSLHYAPSELILFPSTWKNNPLHTANGLDSVSVSAQPGAIGVGSQPFVWNPRQPQGDSDFYALVASAGSPPPDVRSWLQMGVLLTGALNIGFRNTLYVGADESNWVHRVGLHIPASFEVPGQLMLMVSTTGMTGATIGVLANVFNGDRQPIVILPSQVTGDSTTSGIEITLDPGFSASLAIEYWKGSGTPAPGSTITLSASYAVPDHELVEVSSRGLINGGRDRFIQQALGIQPTPMIPLGSVTFIVGH